MKISFEEFAKIEVRVGEVVAAERRDELRNPAFKLIVDFGPPLGQRKTSAQLAVNYSPEVLIGRQLLAVVNFPPKQIGNFMSEVLVLGVPDSNGDVVLVSPDYQVPVGGKLY